MATITPYQTKAGTRYRVRYRKPDRTQTDKRGFKTKRDAKAFAETVEVKKRAGEYIDPTLGRTTIGDLGATWLARKTKIKDSTRAVYQTVLDTHILPKWSAHQVATIGLLDVEDWIGSLSEDRGAQTVRRAHYVLQAILQDAVHGGMIPKNPARGVRNLPDIKKRRHQYLTHQQVDRLASAAAVYGAMYTAIVLTIVYTGMRWGELAALKVRNVDLTTGRIWIGESLGWIKGRPWITTPKNGEAREVIAPVFVRDLLSKLCEGKNPDDLVFEIDGDYLRPVHMEHGWYVAARRAAELPDKLTIHDLRHTSASLAVQAGANVKCVQRMLGHASAALTLDVYADLFDDDLESVAVAMADARQLALAT